MTRTVTVRNRIATGDGGVIVLDNNNYTIVFDLDSEWDSYTTKTMRVQNGTTYTDVVFTGMTATLPQQSGLNVVQIGLYAGNLQTSTPAVFVTLPSIRTAGGSPVSPSSSVYDQIIALLNGFSAAVSKSGDTATITIVDPQGTTTATVSDGAKGDKGDTGAQGPQGETGATGNGIASAVLNADYTLTLTFTDGTSYTTPSIRGAPGEATIDDTTAATDKVYSSSKTNELNSNKADSDGYYETLSVGLADNLIDRKGDGTSQSFTLRTAAGSESIGDDGNGIIKSIHGNTVMWNQLARSIAEGGTFSGITVTANSDGSYVFNGTASEELRFYINKINHALPTNTLSIGGHIYYMQGCPSGGSLSTYFVSYVNGGGELQDYSNQADVGSGIIGTISSLGFRGAGFIIKSGVTLSNVKVSINFIDLTKMFGSGNEPTTVAQFKAMFPLDYYAYNAGSPLSFNGTGIKTVGFNQWDEETESGAINMETGALIVNANRIRTKNFIHVFPNTQYYAQKPSSVTMSGIACYDANKNFISTVRLKNDLFTTPSNASYIKFFLAQTTYNNDICINLSWSGYRNGEYEAYWTNTLSLITSTYYPTGMKSVGPIYDEWLPNKAITRIGAVDMGTLTWTYNDDIFRASVSAAQFPSASTTIANIRCEKYDVVAVNVLDDKTIGGRTPTTVPYIYVKDSSYADAAAFKTAMSGVYLNYELATPTEVAISPALDWTYPVSDFGTEESLPENDDEPTTSPFTGIIKYSEDYTREVTNLPKNYDSTDGLDALCSALSATLSTALNGTFTITRGAYNATTKKYAFTCSFTANS